MVRESVQVWLSSVPLWSTLGAEVLEVAPGHIALRANPDETMRMHGGALSQAAIHGLAEVSASAVVASHPGLAGRSPRLKSTRMKLYATATGTLTATASLNAEQLALARSNMANATKAQAELAVEVKDGGGRRIAIWRGHYTFAPPGA